MINISKGRYWDLPWSLVDGCTPCSPGCDHCWSLAMEKRFHREGRRMMIHDGTGERKMVDITTHPERLDIPVKRRKPTVYAVWNDLMHKDVPSSFIGKTFATIASCQRHTFLILTKRPERMIPFVWPDNVWSGLTVCNQEEADEKIPVFLKVPGKKFLSIEPMLEAIDLTPPNQRGTNCNQDDWLEGIDLIIVGGETGPGARPMHPDWVRSVRDRCVRRTDMGRPWPLPFFFKGWGEWISIAGCYEERECPDMPGVIDGDWPLSEVEKYQGRNEIIAMERSGAIPHWERGNQWRIEHQPRLDAAWIVRIGRKRAGRRLDGWTHDDLPWQMD